MLPCATHLQVDALQMEAFIDGFLASLGVSSAYTVLVINPKWSQALPAYGYRIGFSDKEVAALAEQVGMNGHGVRAARITLHTSVLAGSNCIVSQG